MLDELTSADKVVGLKQVAREAQLGNLIKIYIAMDCDRDIRRELLELSSEYHLEYEMVPTRQKLGDVCGIQVKAACAGLLKADE